MRKDGRDLLEKLEKYLGAYEAWDLRNKTKRLRDFESGDAFSRISNITKKLVGSSESLLSPGGLVVSNEQIAEVIEILRKEGLRGFLAVSLSTVAFEEEGTLKREFIFENSKCGISGRSLEKLKRLQRKLSKQGIYFGIFESKVDKIYEKIEWHQIHINPTAKRSAGRPDENDKQFLYVSLWYMLFDIYFSTSWTTEVPSVKGWRDMVRTAIEHALDEWLSEHGVRIGKSETRFIDFVRKLKEICRNEILITLNTPRPDLELKNQILKSSIGFYLRGYHSFQSTPFISINVLHGKIIKDICRNGVNSIGKFGWYQVGIPEDYSEEYFFRILLDKAQSVFDETYQSFLDIGYDEEDARAEAEREANRLLKD